MLNSDSRGRRFSLIDGEETDPSATVIRRRGYDVQE